MSLWDSILKAKQNIYSRVESALGCSSPETPSATSQENLGQESLPLEALHEIGLDMPEPIGGKEVPETRFSITKGITAHPAYQMKKDHILVGRFLEVFDREGRIVRKNDIVF